VLRRGSSLRSHFIEAPAAEAGRYAGFWQAQLPEEDADRADYLIFTRAPK
jgi:hypothetical protein